MALPRPVMWHYRDPSCGTTETCRVALLRPVVWHYRDPSCGTTETRRVALLRPVVWQYRDPSCGSTETRHVALLRPVVWYYCNKYLGQQYTKLSTDDIILKDLYAIDVSVTNINKSISIHCYSTRFVKLSWSFSLSAK